LPKNSAPGRVIGVVFFFSNSKPSHFYISALISLFVTPSIIALIIIILFVVWFLLNFGIPLILNGLFLLFVLLIIYRDLRHYKEFKLYTGSAIVSAVLIAVFMSWFKTLPFWLITSFILLAFVIVYLIKGFNKLDDKYKIIDKVKPKKK